MSDGLCSIRERLVRFEANVLNRSESSEPTTPCVLNQIADTFSSAVSKQLCALESTFRDSCFAAASDLESKQLQQLAEFQERNTFVTTNLLFVATELLRRLPSKGKGKSST